MTNNIRQKDKCNTFICFILYLFFLYKIKFNNFRRYKNNIKNNVNVLHLFVFIICLLFYTFMIPPSKKENIMLHKKIKVNKNGHFLFILSFCYYISFKMLS